MEQTYSLQNTHERERLYRLCQTLTETDLRRSISNNWTVATKLVHLAFWDRYYLTLLNDWEKYGFKEVKAQVNAINQAVLALSHHIPFNVVISLVNEAALAIDKKVENLDINLAKAIRESGHERILMRYMHRQEHLEQIEQALIPFRRGGDAYPPLRPSSASRNQGLSDCVTSQRIGIRTFSIRPFESQDWKAVWLILEPVFRAGETYAFSPDISEQEAYNIWIELPTDTFVVLDETNTLLGTYYIKPNQAALGAHVCNCGYIVAQEVQGKGIASQMCEHSQQEAIKKGFRAMQYNLVVSTNQGAIRLWQKHGFEIVGSLPRAFKHTSQRICGRICHV